MEKKTSLVLRVVGLQLGISSLLAVLLLLASTSLSTSFFCGAFVAILPNLGFGYLFFRRWRERSAKQIIISFYIGELGKLVLSGMLAIFLLKLFHMRLGMFIVGMAAAYIIFWVAAPLIMQRQYKAGA